MKSSPILRRISFRDKGILPCLARLSGSFLCFRRCCGCVFESVQFNRLRQAMGKGLFGDRVVVGEDDEIVAHGGVFAECVRVFFDLRFA